MGTDEQVCSVCGQPVATVVRRHKTLGAWVPAWVAGPCRNPECGTYADESDESGRAAPGAPGLRTPGGTASGTAARPGPAPGSPAGAAPGPAAGSGEAEGADP
ncbi:hypothetical protein [Streptomyces sp. NPDC005907]|uniref:hypothetical protein n=1 Tax=Streptomyces sp. NPDC005907 TaxID=3154571 RepID=UPI0034084A12